MSAAGEKVVDTAEEVADDVGHAYGSWFKSYMKIFGRRALEWFLVYMFGYYNVSFGWLMAPLFFLVLRDKRAKEKKIKFDIIRSIANADEKDIIQEIQRFSNLPSWVTFPDMERVEWLNKIIRQLWPYAGQYVKDLCKYSIEPSMRTALEEYKLNGFQFEKIILGDTPPRFSGVKVYDDTSRHEIIMDMDFAYAGDCKFEVSVSKFKMGIKDLQISGRLRVMMKPLVKQIPLVGGLQVFFLNNPDVDFNLIGLADVFDMPGLSDILRSIVTEQIGHMMVLPNRYPIQLVDDIDVVELKCPAPAGVIRLNVIEAQNLMKKDIGIMGTGKSDPYCILRLGAQKFQTKTINNTVNPKWDFCCEFLTEVIQSQELDFELFDLDDGPGRDEFLGRANLDVQEIWKNGEVDMWVPLSEAKSGRIHIRATWLDLSDTADSLQLQLEEIRALQVTTKNPLHSAVLMVWVDSAKKLNPSHKQIPDPFVRLYVGNEKGETAVRQRTNDPVFEEGFTFLVRNPRTQELKLEVIDQKTTQIQGKVELDLNVFLKERKMEVIGEDYSLSGASGGLSTLKLNITLRILKTALKTDDGDGGPQEKGETEISSSSPAAISEPPPSSSSSSMPPSTPAPSIPSKESVGIPDPIPADVPEQKSAPVREPGSLADQSEGPSVATDADVSVPAPGGGIEPPTEVTSVEEVMSTAATPLMQMFPSATSSEESSIRQRTTPASNAGIHGLGRVQLTVKYGPRNNLIIVVHQIENLPKEEDGELPDPYVKLYLLPDRSKDSKRKTDVIKDDCNPKYDERFEYPIPPNELTQRTLEVSVINKKGLLFLQRSPKMGQVRLDCGLLDSSKMTQWYDLAPAADDDEE
ncbi:LOW QUALITY PROTEIN: extended synaptotagmin-1-like [Penaeus chinensis]|uniref:LOW QUALITY PROTEIN: extended synaptotagmin-1-like n=1 Tax=Penaeus chinensis TaxID=139456 RepID=UPI001FB6AD7C|nr:LOW QUALITY PROTEIN: extended synaptotagmin-1-like [Penaeus chinensis]